MAGIDIANVFTGSSGVYGEQALDTTSGANDSYYFIDLEAGKDAFGQALANPDIGMGKPMFVNFLMTAALDTTSDNSTMTWAVYDGATTDAITNALFTSPALSVTTLAAGYKSFIALPPSTQRYLKCIFTTAVADITAGKVYAWLSGEPHANK